MKADEILEQYAVGVRNFVVASLSEALWTEQG